eukprot:g40045.t1
MGSTHSFLQGAMAHQCTMAHRVTGARAFGIAPWHTGSQAPELFAMHHGSQGHRRHSFCKAPWRTQSQAPELFAIHHGSQGHRRHLTGSQGGPEPPFNGERSAFSRVGSS